MLMIHITGILIRGQKTVVRACVISIKFYPLILINAPESDHAIVFYYRRNILSEMASQGHKAVIYVSSMSSIII